MTIRPNTALMQLFLQGPTWDGNLISKEDRDTLVSYGWAMRTDGWNFLTKRGVQAAVAAGLLQRHDNKAWYDKAVCK